MSTYIKKCINEEQPEAVKENANLESSIDVGNTLYEFFDDNEQINETVLALSMADVLVAFLECLPDPVVPVSLYEAALKAAENGSVPNVSIYLQ